MQNKQNKISQLEDKVRDLENQHDVEVGHRQFAEALLDCFKSISDVGVQGEAVFRQVFERINGLIPFDKVFILVVDGKERQNIRVYFCDQNFDTELVLLPFSQCLKDTKKIIRTIGKLEKNHGVDWLETGQSCMIVPFESQGADYFILFANSKPDIFEPQHIEVAKHVSVVVKQAIQNKELLAKLIHSDKMVSIGMLAGGIAHEINNPLTIIQGTAQILEVIYHKSYDDKERIMQYLKKIKDTTSRISRIVSGLKRVAYRKDEVETEAVLLNEVLADVIVICEDKFKSNQIEIRFDENSYEFDKIMRCDRVQLSQVILNIVNNALDAVKDMDVEEKWIQLKCHDDAAHDSCVIEIIDCGDGIPSAVRSKLFNPFFTTKELGVGTGLGLSIAQGIMRSMHGDLVLNENHQNTCFQVVIPRAA